MEFEDVQDKVYGALCDEYSQSDKKWGEFILYKNLGIEYKPVFHSNTYKIIDEKKWLLTKIKYGL